MVRNRLAAKHMHQLVKQSCCRLFEKSVGITVIAHAIDNLTAILITFQELIQCFNILLQVCINCHNRICLASSSHHTCQNRTLMTVVAGKAQARILAVLARQLINNLPGAVLTAIVDK